MFRKKNDISIENIQEEDEKKYLEVMKLYDDLISLVTKYKPGLVSELKKNKESVRNKYIDNLYGSEGNKTNPYFNRTFFDQIIPKIKSQIESQKALIEESKKMGKIQEVKEQEASRFLKERIHEKADPEFSTLLKWLQEFNDNYLLIFNKIDFEIFTKRKVLKLTDTLFKYSNFHTNSLLKQYIFELDSLDRMGNKKGYNNFHIKFLETVVKDWFWLYDTIFWIIGKEFDGEKIFNNPDETIIFSDEELQLDSNREYAKMFHNKSQLEAFKLVAKMVKEVYLGLEIEKIAAKFNIELRPL